jgi:hypothetical protein
MKPREADEHAKHRIGSLSTMPSACAPLEIKIVDELDRQANRARHRR